MRQAIKKIKTPRFAKGVPVLPMPLDFGVRLTVIGERAISMDYSSHTARGPST